MKLHLPKALIAALASVYTLAAPLATTLATGTLFFAATSPLYAEGEGDESATQGEDEEVTVSPNIPADATITWTTATATTKKLSGSSAQNIGGDNINISSGTNSNFAYVNGETRSLADGLWVDVTGTACESRLFAVHSTPGSTNQTLTSDVYLRIGSSYTGTSTWGTILGIQANWNRKATIDGDLYMEFSSEALTVNGVMDYSVAGAYDGSVTGACTLVFKAGTFQKAIYGGNTSGDFSIGSTNVQISGGTFKGNIYAGSAAGEVGSTQLTFYGNGFTFGSDVDLITSGGSGTGTVTGNTVMSICNMADEDGGLGGYSGTLTGNEGGTVGGDRILNFINSTHSNFTAILKNFDVINLVNSSIALATAPENPARQINIDANSTLTTKEGVDLTIGGTIQLDGNLVLGGYLQVESLAILDPYGSGQQYYDRISGSTDNGYENAVYQVYRGNGSLSFSTEGADREIYVGNTAYEIDNIGQVRVGESNGRYFVRKGEVVYGATDNLTASATTNTIALDGAEGNGTLVLKQALNNNVSLTLVSNSGLKIEENVTMSYTALPSSTTGATLTISGSGTIDLGSNATAKNLVDTLNSNTSLAFDANWTGCIRVSGLNFDGGNNNKKITVLNDLQRGNGWVEVMNSSGWTNNTESNITANIRLTGDEALKIDDGYSGTAFTTNFNGKVGGTGNLVFTASGTYNPHMDSFYFNEDVSDWTGSLILRHEGNTDSKTLNLAKFGGTGAINVNFDVTHKGNNKNTMNIEIAGTSGDRAVASNFTHGTGDIINLTLSGAATKTFSGSVDIATLGVTGGAATINGTLAATTVTVGTADANGSLTIGATGVATLQDVSVNSGTLSFAAGSTVTVNGTFNTAVAVGNLATDNGNNPNSNSINFTGGSGFVKSGAGSLALKGNIALSDTTINGGILQIQTSTGIDLGNITLGSETVGDETRSGVLSLVGLSDNNRKASTIQTLTLNNDATVETQYGRTVVEIQGLHLNDHTLTIDDHHRVAATNSNFNLSGASAGSGTVVVNQASQTTWAVGVTLTLTGTETLSEATLQFGSTNSTNTGKALVLDLATDTVKIAGLTGGNEKTYIISRAYSTAKDVQTTSDKVFRTLELTGAGTYSFGGAVKAQVNLVKSGTGTQEFTGNTENVNGSILVEHGGLSFATSIGTSDNGAVSSITVNSGASLSLAANSATNELNLAGTLALTSGTLTVNNILSLTEGNTISIADDGASLALAANCVIDLTKLTGTEVVDQAGSYAYTLFDTNTYGKVTGLTNGAIGMDRIRANGIGWTATYADGVITLSQIADSNMLVWNDNDVNEVTWNTDTSFEGDSHISSDVGATNYVSVKTSVTANLNGDLSLTGLDVKNGVTLTLGSTSEDATSDPPYTLTVTDINLEAGATLNAGSENVTMSATSIDLSEGSTFITTNRTNASYTGSGTVKIALDTNGEAVSMGANSQFTGVVEVTSGTLQLNGSGISNGTWKLADGAGAKTTAAATVSNDIVLAGTHVLNTGAATTLSGKVSGGSLTKNGSGALTLSGVTDLASLTVSAGKITLSGTVTLGNFTVESGASVDDNSFGVDLTVNGELNTVKNLYQKGGSFTAGENFIKSGSGQICFNKDVAVLIGGLDLQGGTVKFITDSSYTDGSVSSQINLGAVTMANGTTIMQAHTADNNNQRQIRLDSLTLTGAEATLNAGQTGSNGKGCYFSVGDLVLDGHTLKISDSTTADARWSKVVFDGTQDSSDTVGTVDVSSQRSIAISIAKDTALQKSTLKVTNPSTSGKSAVLAIAADNVQVFGLNGTAASAWKLVSTANLPSGSDDNGVLTMTGDGTVRTLTLTGTDTYTFAGSVGGNLNLVKNGTGTQNFTGTVSDFNGNVTVNAGTLAFGNAITAGKAATLAGTATLEIAANASFETLTGVSGTTLTTGSESKATITLTGEGGTFAGTLTNFGIALGADATGTHAFTGTMSDVGTVSVAGGTLDLTTSTSEGRTLELNTLTLSGGALVNGTTTADSQGSITIADGGTLTATGGTLENTSLTVDVNQVTDKTLSTAIINGSLTVNEADQGATPAVLTLASPAAMQLNDLTAKANIQLNTDVDVSGTLTLVDGGEINFGDKKQLTYHGYTFTNLDLTANQNTTEGDAGSEESEPHVNVGKLDVVYDQGNKEVVAQGLRISRLEAAEAYNTMDYQMTGVRFVNAVGDTTLTANNSSFTEIVVSGGSLTLAASMGATRVSDDVTMAVPSGTMTVKNGATIATDVITLTGLGTKDLDIDNKEGNASVFHGGSAEQSGAILTNAAATVNNTDAKNAYLWGAKLVNSTVEVTAGDLTLTNDNTLYKLAASGHTVSLTGNTVITNPDAGSGSATVGTLVVSGEKGALTVASGASMKVGHSVAITAKGTSGMALFGNAGDSTPISGGTVSNVTVNDNSIAATDSTDGKKGSISDATVTINGGTAETPFSIEHIAMDNTLVELKSASTVNLSDVAMQDTGINASGSSVVYGGSGSATAVVTQATAGTGEDANKLTANTVVQNGGTASGALTVDLGSELLIPGNAGKTLTWTILQGVTIGASGFTLSLGDVLKTIVNNGLPVVTLSITNGSGTTPVVLTSANVTAAGALTQSVGDLITGNVAALTLTIDNIPEPTTGTLGVLALAALAARRRRRK